MHFLTSQVFPGIHILDGQHEGVLGPLLLILEGLHAGQPLVHLLHEHQLWHLLTMTGNLAQPLQCGHAGMQRLPGGYGFENVLL